MKTWNIVHGILPQLPDDGPPLPAFLGQTWKSQKYVHGKGMIPNLTSFIELPDFVKSSPVYDTLEDVVDNVASKVVLLSMKLPF